MSTTENFVSPLFLAGLEHVSVKDVRNKLGEKLTEVFYLHKRIVFVRYGTEAAVMVSVRDYMRLCERAGVDADTPLDALDRAAGD